MTTTVFGLDLADLNLLLSNIPESGELILSEFLGLKLHLPLEEVAVDAYQELEIPNFYHPEILAKREKIHILRNIIMESGLTLYSELVANFLFRGNYLEKLSVKDYFQILLGEFPQPHSFADFCTKAGKQLKYCFNDTSKEMYRINVQQERLKEITRIYKRFSRLCKEYDVRFDQDALYRFIRSADLVTQITDPNKQRRYEDGFYGDLDRALFEAVILGKPIDLIKIQCMRMLQTCDISGRNRLSISTSIGYEEIVAKDGKVRIFQDTSRLVDYLAYLSARFAEIGIKIRPIIAIADDDVRNMYRNETVIPESDINSIQMKALIYRNNLMQYSRSIGCEVEVYLITHLAAGTGYEEIKNLVCQDCIGGGKLSVPIISEREYGAAVQADQKKYGGKLGYPIEESKYKVGMSFGVFRGLYQLGQEVGQARESNPVFIARSKPGIQKHMAVSTQGKGTRIPVLMPYSDGLEVFYQRGRF